MVGGVLDLPGTVKGQVETGMAYYNATGSVLTGISGGLGMADLSEAIVGTDIITGEQISGDERFDRAMSGFAATLGTAASIGGAMIKIPVIGSRIPRPKCWFNQCFPAGTLVAVPDGHRAIEKIKAGDEVMSYDIITSEWKVRRILTTVNDESESDSVFVTAGGETIESTYHHPYGVVDGENLQGRPVLDHHDVIPDDATTPGRWSDAGDLQRGDVLLTRDGRQLVIDEVRIEPANQTVYNFEVDEFHCYAVGKSAILVHNARCHEAEAAKPKSTSKTKNDRSQPPGGTYKLIDADGKVRRTGRTKDLARRELEHWRDPETTGLKFKIDRRTDSYPQMRGREQIIYDKSPAALPQNGGLNRVRGISLKNKRFQEYMDAGAEL